MKAVLISRKLFPAKYAEGRRDNPQWRTYPGESTVVESAGDGKYGRIIQIGFKNDKNEIMFDGLLWAESGGAVSIIMNEHGEFGLIRQERPVSTKSEADWKRDYATGTIDVDALGKLSWELPRGYGELDELTSDTASRETEEETGFAVVRKILLYRGNENTAHTPHMTAKFLVLVNLNKLSSLRPDLHEKIETQLTFFSANKILEMIENGEIFCDMTISSITSIILRRLKARDREIAILKKKLAEK